MTAPENTFGLYHPDDTYPSPGKPVSASITSMCTSDVSGQTTLYAGATVKYLRETLVDSVASGVAADAGILYAPRKARWRLGAVLQNFGAHLSDFGSSRSMPSR